jgi:hypothetical protein
MARITDALHGDLSKFMIISGTLLLRMFQRKFVEKIKTYFLTKTFFQKIESFMRLCGKIE